MTDPQPPAEEGSAPAVEPAPEEASPAVEPAPEASGPAVEPAPEAPSDALSESKGRNPGPKSPAQSDRPEPPAGYQTAAPRPPQPAGGEEPAGGGPPEPAGGGPPEPAGGGPPQPGPRSETPAGGGPVKWAVGLLVALVVAFAVMAAVLTPWHPLPGAHITAAPLHRFFTSGEIARSDAFFEAARWPSWLGLAVSLAVAVAVAFTPFGRALARAAKHALPRWWLQVLVLAVAVVLIQTLATLGFAAWGRTIAQRYGLDRQSWAGWARDIAVQFAITAVITALVLLLLVALVRKLPRIWFAPAAAGAAALVVLGSFAYPVVVQPLFMSFTPMPPGPLRTHLLALAHRDGVRVSDVLVADASSRTTAENAYVSGFGATKRIVVYDTLLSAPPRQVELVVAHELGHAKNNDVLTGTIEGAVATAAAMVGLFLLLRWGRLRHPVRAASAADAAVVPLVLGLAVLAQFLALPVQDSMSRQVEARADAHALQLTGDPHDFIAMQRRLALTNLEHLTPNPVLAFWFANHPTTLQRIGMALAWERLNSSTAPTPGGSR